MTVKVKELNISIANRLIITEGSLLQVFCWLGLLVQERRCWHVLLQARQMYRSTMRPAPSLMRCLLGLVQVELETFSVSISRHLCALCDSSFLCVRVAALY